MLGRNHGYHLGRILIGLLIAACFACCAVAHADDAPSQNTAGEFQKLPLGIDLSNHFQEAFGDDKKTDASSQKDKNNSSQSQKIALVDFADPQNLTIRAAKTFTAEQVKKALACSLSVRLAQMPSTQLQDFLQHLSDAIAAGYRQAGFASPKVRVGFDVATRSFTVDVDEGDRYLAGDIVVHNANTVSAEKLAARLRSKHLPRDATLKSVKNTNGKRTEVWVDKDGKEVEFAKPVWVAGKPVAIAGWSKWQNDRYRDAATREPAEAINDDIKAALEEQGYFFAEFEASLVLDAAKETADLVIDIRNEGSPAEIGEIEVVGNQINTKEEVLEYLGLKPGMTFNREDLSRLNAKLWDAARFITAKVTPVNPASADDKILLRIELQEYPHAPSLSKPFSAEEQIALKCCDWLSDDRNWGGDFLLRMDSEANWGEMIDSPEDGAVVRYHWNVSDGDRAVEEWNYDYIASPKEFGIYSHPTERKFQTSVMDGTVIIGLELKLSEKAEDGKALQFAFGAGVKSAEKDEPAHCPVLFHLSMQPACFPALLHEHNAKAALENGVLTIRDENNSVWEIDAATGRLLTMKIDYDPRDKPPSSDVTTGSGKESPAQGEPPKGSKSTSDDVPCKLELHFVKGAVAEAVEKIHHECADFTNEYVPERPLGSFGAFACQDPAIARYLTTYGYNAKWLPLASKLFGMGAIDFIDQWVTGDSQSGDDDQFGIPGEPDSCFPQFNIANPNTWMIFATFINDEAFPWSSGPWSLMQQGSLISLNRSNELTAEVNRLYSSRESGPLVALAEACLFEHIQPGCSACRAFAERGLNCLEKTAFLKDCQPFLSKDHEVGKCLQKLVGIYRFLSDEEIRVLAEGLDDQTLKYLAVCDRVLRSDPSKDFDKVMPELLGELWDAGVKEQVEQALTRLRDGK